MHSSESFIYTNTHDIHKLSRSSYLKKNLCYYNGKAFIKAKLTCSEYLEETELTEVGVSVGERIGRSDAAVDAVSVPLAALTEKTDRLQWLVIGAHLNSLWRNV